MRLESKWQKKFLTAKIEGLRQTLGGLKCI